MSVLVEEVEIVGLVGLRLPERGLPLFQHHVHVVSTGLAHGDVGMDQEGR